MFGSLTRRPAFWIAVVVAAAVVAMLLGACGDPGQRPVPVCATWQAPDGTWMEEDNEPVDAYPCDTDIDLPHVKPTTKKPAPAKSTAPIGGKKKRF